MRTPIYGLVLATVFFSPLFSSAQSKTSFSLKKVPDQWSQVRGVPEVVADQQCENWAWAAGVETILKKEGVSLDQKHWIDKLNGGALCQPSAGDIRALAKLIDGKYILPDGKKFKLEARYLESTPTTADRLLVPLAWGRPYILWWKGHAYVVDGAKWDEYIYPNGQKSIEMKEISLLDPYFTGEKRHATWTAEEDSTKDIGGMFEVLVTPIEDVSPWKP